MFTNKKRAGMNTFACAVFLFAAETPKTSIKDHEPQLSRTILSRTVLLDNLSRNSCMVALVRDKTLYKASNYS